MLVRLPRVGISSEQVRPEGRHYFVVVSRQRSGKIQVNTFKIGTTSTVLRNVPSWTSLHHFIRMFSTVWEFFVARNILILVHAQLLRQVAAFTFLESPCAPRVIEDIATEHVGRSQKFTRAKRSWESSTMCTLWVCVLLLVEALRLLWVVSLCANLLHAPFSSGMV